MNTIGLTYMCAAWFMLGLIIGYAIANQDVVRVKTDAALEEMLK